MRTRTRTAAALTAAALIGLGIGVGPHVFSSDASASREFDTQHSVRTIRLPGHGADLSAAELSRRFEIPRAGSAPAAPDPRTAVQRFLTGLIMRNDRGSYTQLSSADLVTFPTVGTWIRRQAGSPRVLAATITAVAVHGNAANVAVQLRQQPVLDEVEGLVPSHAHARYAAMREDGGWRVALAQSDVVEDYFTGSNIDGAREAAIAWAGARSRCADASRWQWRAGLYGDGAELTATGLCRAGRSPVRAGTARSLDDRDQSAPLLAAFGPEVGLWARVVPLTWPHGTASLVLAPVGEHWLVVGVLSSSSIGGQG